MDSETMSHLFEPFYTTKEAGKGTGLGLAAVYGCVKGHNGGIEVQSSKDAGTVFRIILPLLETDGIPETSKTREFIIGSMCIRVLLVDDDPDIRESYSTALAEFGFKIETAASGNGALEVYRSRQPYFDIVILDMMMPGMNGRDTYLELKKINPEIRALLLTGYSIEKEAQELLRSGIRDIVEKPVSPRKLAHHIKAALK
jgi:CheY-like chemotaxis protein